MAYLATVIPVMIVSPSDVLEEREVIRSVLHDLNNIHAKSDQCVFLPVGWDTHSSSELGARGQDLINQRVLRDSDLLVAAFRHRIGTPTGGFPSGSVEEIRRHMDAGKPAMVYFYRGEPPDGADPQQLQGLREFRDWCSGNGLWREYASTQEFRVTLDREVRIAINDNPYLSGLVRRADAAGGVGIPGIRQAPPGSDLSVEARRLLLAASQDTNGMILQHKSLGGWGLQVSGKDLTDGTARNDAKWKAALEKLEEKAFIRAIGTKRELFEVTDAGYTLADHLRPGTDSEQLL